MDWKFLLEKGFLVKHRLVPLLLERVAADFFLCHQQLFVWRQKHIILGQAKYCLGWSPSAQNSCVPTVASERSSSVKKIYNKNYKDLKVQKWRSVLRTALGDEGDACYQRDARNRTNLSKSNKKYIWTLIAINLTINSWTSQATRGRAVINCFAAYI